MDFVAIDFETANEKRSSPCCMGLVVALDGVITYRNSWLIRPKEPRFRPYNTQLHGIRAEDVLDAPAWPEVWGTIGPHLRNKPLIAHNASFDISVICQTSQDYGIQLPDDLVCCCTREISRRLWPRMLSYSLSFLAQQFQIEFCHHNALEDARVCAEIALRACRETDSRSLDQLLEKLAALPYEARSRRSYSKFRPKDLEPESDEINPDHPFFSRMFAFTGELDSLTRKEAMQAVVNVGGECGSTINKYTNYLVVGQQDLSKLCKGETKSSKMKKAEAMIADGQELEILNEHEFLDLLLS